MTSFAEELQAELGSAFTLERELGGGGMSRVFVAEEMALGRKVVVKVLPPELAAQVSLERFQREIMLAARLQHPHIVPVLTAGGTSRLPYFTMPFVEGESLRARLVRGGELPLTEATRVLREIGSALAYAHERGIVHRDIKPDNVLLSGGAAMVTDFGVAKALSASSQTGGGSVTSSGVALGTPAYMAPEQATADPLMDHRVDIYAFGTLAYEVLTGQPPFVGRTAQGFLAAQVMEVPETITRRRSAIPAALAAIIMRCLEKRPADRPQSAGEIVHVLDDMAAMTTPTLGLPGRAAPDGASRRHLRPLLWGMLMIAVVGFVGWSFRSRFAAPPSAEGATSIAVLPFENASLDTSMAFFADGMTDELATALSEAGFRVAGRQSVTALQAKHVSDHEAVRLLGVQTLLHGNVRRSGLRLRVWTQLVNGTDGIALWTRTYDTTFTDVFHVQDDLARAIAAELRPRLNVASGQMKMDAARGTNDLLAYEQYMKGRYYADKFEDGRAIAAFELAIKRDPAYSRAYAALAKAYGNQAIVGGPSSDSIRLLQRQAADRSLQLDTSRAEGYGAVGDALMSEWRFQEAEAALKKGLALQPDNPDLNLSYAVVLIGLGRMSEGLAAAKRVQRVDPLALTGIAIVQYCLEMMGRLDEARAESRRGLELDSSFVPLYQNLGVIEAFSGQPDAALTDLKRAYDFDPKLYGNSAYMLFGYAVAGRWSDVDRIRVQIERDVPGSSPNFFRAMIALVNGDRANAAMAVERGFDRHEPLFLFVFAPCDPMFDLIKSEPRFRALMQRYGMKICAPFARWPIPHRPPGGALHS